MISTLTLVICGLLGISMHIIVESVPMKIVSLSKRPTVQVVDSSLHLERKRRNDVYDDMKMSSTELNTLGKKRRNMQINHRRRRSSVYNINPTLEPYSDRQAFNRHLFPNTWLDRRYTRFNHWNDFYENNNENHDYNMPLYLSTNDDDLSDEYNRYRIPSKSPYDNLQLQQEYNIIDIPFDDYDEIYAL